MAEERGNRPLEVAWSRYPCEVEVSRRKRASLAITTPLAPRASSSPRREVWEIKRLFTWRDFDQAAFFNTEFSERDLADIGLALVTRLAALAAGKKRG